MTVASVRIEGLRGVLDTLSALPPELVSKRGGPVRFALRKAALVLRDEALVNLQKIIDAPNKDGLPNDSTGLLAKNVVAARGRAPVGQNGETFRVRVRNKAYPKEGNAKTVTTAQVARLLEYGSEKRAPLPWIRPAFETKKELAVATFATEINKKLDSIVKKLAKQNGVRG